MLCSRCKENFGLLSTSDAGLKRGHLFMAIQCLKNLNCPAFRKQFLPKSILEEWQEAADGEPKATKNEKSGDDGGDNDSVAQAEKDEADNDQRHVPTNAKSVGVFNLDGAADDYNEALRYELTDWYYHAREAERLWPQDKRDTEQWATLHDEINTFLDENSDHLKVWQISVMPGRRFKTFDPPIHTAARFGLSRSVQDFIENGGDVNIENENQGTPLNIVCQGQGNYVGLEYLVEHGADIQRTNTLDQGTLLHTLINNDGPAEKLRYLLSKGVDPTVRNRFGHTVLHLAVSRRSLENVRALLECPGVDVNATDQTGGTPLHWLFHFPNTPSSILQLLLDNGANVNQRNQASQAPLYMAC